MTKESFFEGINDWSNHRVLLWYALEATKGDVIEMGCGDGSTPFLHAYCEEKKRKLFSFDTDKEWLGKYEEYIRKWHSFTHIVNNWHIVKDICKNPSVILVDHAPGERRIVDLARFEEIEGILVCHDTQPKPTAANYNYELMWPSFKYKVDLKVPPNPEANRRGVQDNRTWASAVSNFYDVTQWKGLETGNPDYTLV